MRQSPFGSKTTKTETKVITPNQFEGAMKNKTLTAKADQLPAAKSPFHKEAVEIPSARAIRLPVTEKDIEALGSDTPNRVSATVETITSKVMTNKFGQLGDLLVELESNSDLLNPNNYGKAKGIVGWFKNAVVDVRKTMRKNLATAEASFKALENKMVEEIQLHEQWKKDLDSMYAENEQNYYAICGNIKTADEWVVAMRETLANLPPIDPTDETAMMQSQMIRRAEQTINLCSMKADTFRRCRVLVENMAPKILAQKDASEHTIQTFRNLITQVIPIVKMEFALYMQTLAVKGSNEFQEGAKSISENMITQSSQSAADSIVAASKTANTAMISNEALNSTRNTILGAITAVRQIEQQSQAQRVQDARMMQESQAQYLKDLQSHNAV